MKRQYAEKHTGRRALAVLLSLLMLLQSVSAFADDIDVPEANPEETIETAAQLPEAPEGENTVPPENPATQSESTAASDNDTEIPAGIAEIPADDNGTSGENAEIPAEEAVPEPTPIIDTSESITMLQAGFVPAPVYFEGTLVHEGPDYTVTAVIGQDAMFPADVSMRVEEILPGTELYE